MEIVTPGECPLNSPGPDVAHIKGNIIHLPDNPSPSIFFPPSHHILDHQEEEKKETQGLVSAVPFVHIYLLTM